MVAHGHTFDEEEQRGIQTMNITGSKEPDARRVMRTSDCEMRLTLSDSSGAGHGLRCAGRSLFLTKGKQAW
jgi:hypothetical protein